MVFGKENSIDTQLAIIIDPPKQTPEQAASRTRQFLEGGGKAVLIGGSGIIEEILFQDTVEAITEITQRHLLPVWILPGHINQIPLNNRGISGVFNYKDIMGSEGQDFNAVYPPKARDYVSVTLQARQIPNIATLYVLCGNPESSVSKESGILPLDLASFNHRRKFFKGAVNWLKTGIDCIFFEAGSGSTQHANKDVVQKTRREINSLSPEVLLFVSGGIKHPAQVRLFAGIADYVVIGGYFEINGAKRAEDFVYALKKD